MSSLHYYGTDHISICLTLLDETNDRHWKTMTKYNDSFFSNQIRGNIHSKFSKNEYCIR